MKGQNYHVSFASRLPCERLSFQRGFGLGFLRCSGLRHCTVATPLGHVSTRALA